MKKGEKGFALKRQHLTSWIIKYCLSIDGVYMIPTSCIIALKGGVYKAVILFTKYLLGSKKTLSILKMKTKTLFKQSNTGLQVVKAVKGNATKPQILRELFKVQSEYKKNLS